LTHSCTPEVYKFLKESGIIKVYIDYIDSSASTEEIKMALKAVDQMLNVG